MRRIFLTAAVLLLSYTGFSELDVEWIDANTIRVTGYGNGGDGTVVTNWLGCCTNCTLITPEELTAGMDRIISKCSDIDSLSHNLDIVASSGLDNVQSKIDEIGTFRRVGPNSASGTSSTAMPLFYSALTSYVYSVDNTQTSLDRSYIIGTTTLGAMGQAVSYNDGIYDYANSYVLPYLDSDVRGDYVLILDTNSQITQKVASISSVAEQYRNLSSCPCGDDSGGGGGGGCAWTQDQIDALLGYVDHIDQDQHKRFVQLTSISNDVESIYERFDSYAKIVSRVLYQDGTIVVDDGENSWSNVYVNGSSELYNYDKSNVLQRIELLLYSFAFTSPTNWENKTDDEVKDYVDDIDDHVKYITNTVVSAHDEYKSNVQTLSGKFDALWSAMNFFGSGNLGNFSYGEPFQFDVYDFSPDFMNAADLRPLQQVCRTAMQIFYWTSGVVFLLYFWYRVVTFTTGIALRIINFFNQLMT